MATWSACRGHSYEPSPRRKVGNFVSAVGSTFGCTARGRDTRSGRKGKDYSAAYRCTSILVPNHTRGLRRLAELVMRA